MINTDNKTNYAIGAGVGLLSGVTGGLAAGVQEANKYYESTTCKAQGFTKGMTKDQFVMKQLQAMESEIMPVNKTEFEKVSGEAFDRIKAHGKKIRHKWLAGFAAAGIALGIGMAAIANKIKADKAQAAAKEIAVGEIPAEDALAEEAPIEEIPTEEIPTEDTPAE